jgi:oxygen-independent coproporphyrinogen-3 oxidase
VANLKNIKDMVWAIVKELEIRKREWNDCDFDTIYFGGGTPSVLDIEDILTLCDAIFLNYNIKPDIEFTIEANPDDLNLTFLDLLQKKNKDQPF